MSLETNGPISGYALPSEFNPGPNQQLQYTYARDPAKGHCSWEFFDTDGVSVHSGSASLNGLARGAILDTIDMTGWSVEYTFEINLSGKHNGTVVGGWAQGGAVDVTGSGHFTARMRISSGI